MRFVSTDSMTTIGVFVKKEIEIPDSVTIRGTECVAEFYDDSDFDGDENYTYYMTIDEDGVSWEIRVYEQSMNDEVFVAAVVNNDIKESCYTAPGSSSVSIVVRSLAKFLDEYER